MLNIRKMRFDNSPIMSNTQISLPLHKDCNQFVNQIVTVFFVKLTGQFGDSLIFGIYIFASVKM